MSSFWQGMSPLRGAAVSDLSLLMGRGWAWLQDPLASIGQALQTPEWQQGPGMPLWQLGLGVLV